MDLSSEITDLKLDKQLNVIAVRYYGVVALIYSLFSLVFILNGKADFDTVLFQNLILFVSYAFFILIQHRPLSSIEVFLNSIFYASFTCGLFWALDYIDTPPDSLYYTRVALKLTNSQNNLWSDVFTMVKDPSDWGGIVLSAFGYILGGKEYGPLVLVSLKIFLYAWACVAIYRLLDTIYENKEWIKIILGLVAFNSYVPYFATSGLKELVFAFIVVLAVYYLYKVLQVPTLINFLLFAIFTIVTFFFRAMFPIFFVFAFMACKYFAFLLKPKIIMIAIASGFVLVLFFSFLLQEYLPMAALGIQERLSMEKTNQLFKYLNIINAFVSPYPAVNSTNQFVNFTTFQYGVMNSSFAIWGILGLYHCIKEKLSDLFPAMIILLMNSFMLIIYGFAMNARYTYVTIFCLYVFVPLGLAYYFKWKYMIPYLLFILSLSFVYNMR